MSTIMLQGYKSYLTDYVATDDPAGETYLNEQHQNMNNLVSDVSKKASDDYKSSQKLLEHFAQMSSMFTAA